jgi:hypothetical protein
MSVGKLISGDGVLRGATDCGYRLRMPHVDGAELVFRLARDFPCQIISASAAETVEMQALNSGTYPGPTFILLTQESLVGFTMDIERVRHAWDSGYSILSAVSI